MIFRKRRKIIFKGGDGDRGNGERAYLTLVRRGVAWRDVPRLGAFLRLWNRIQPPERRRALLARHRVFATQLVVERGGGDSGDGDENDGIIRAAVAADDARAYLAAAIPAITKAATPRHEEDDYDAHARPLIRAGAARCLRALLAALSARDAAASAGFRAAAVLGLTTYAIERVQPNCLRELLARGAALPESALVLAAASGDQRTLRAAIDAGAPNTHTALNFLAHITTLYGNAHNAATIVGSLPCLRMLLERGVERSGSSDAGLVFNAASFGHLPCLRYLQLSPHAPPVASLDLPDALLPAVRGGHVDCIRYALDQKCCNRRSIIDTACSVAASCGQLRSLILLRERNCPWTERTTLCAAAAGSLECLRYAHENGCPWTQRTVLCAAAYNHLECMRYAIDHGCPFDLRAAKIVAKSRCRAYLSTLTQ